MQYFLIFGSYQLHFHDLKANKAAESKSVSATVKHSEHSEHSENSNQSQANKAAERKSVSATFKTFKPYLPDQ